MRVGRRGQDWIGDINGLQVSGSCLARSGRSLARPLLDVKEMSLQRMNADFGGTRMPLILLLDFQRQRIESACRSSNAHT